MGKRRTLRNSGPSKANRLEETGNASSRDREEDIEVDSNDEEENEEEEEENLFQQSSDEKISMTFEFNDMKEPYCYGVAKMLEFLLPPHETRDIGEMVANQGL
jgi:hypothetical protein